MLTFGFSASDCWETSRTCCSTRFTRDRIWCLAIDTSAQRDVSCSWILRCNDITTRSRVSSTPSNACLVFSGRESLRSVWRSETSLVYCTQSSFIRSSFEILAIISLDIALVCYVVVVFAVEAAVLYSRVVIARFRTKICDALNSNMRNAMVFRCVETQWSCVRSEGVLCSGRTDLDNPTIAISTQEHMQIGRQNVYGNASFWLGGVCR